MTSLILLYRGPATPPGASHEGWPEWFHSAGDKLVDKGSPMANGFVLHSDGTTTDTAASLNGYSIIRADDRDQALALLRDHPFLAPGREYAIRSLRSAGQVGKRKEPLMLGRKTYDQEELDHCKEAMQKQLAAYKRLVKSIDGNTADKKAASALRTFETLFFNNLTLALDRYFVHRLRVVTGKDSNPLNEVELLADSLMNNEGVLRTNNVIRYDPDESVVKLHAGDQIKLAKSDFERLSSAFFAELERRFLESKASTTRQRGRAAAGSR